MIRFHSRVFSVLICCVLLSVFYSREVNAQAQPAQQQQPVPFQMVQPHPAAKLAQRMEIDAKRAVTDINGDDALPRSREFLRVDSSYYVGWMYEGVSKYIHAADYLGFKNASVPLEHALYSMERDYKKFLSNRTPDVIQYIGEYRFHLDYTQIAYYLMNCYSNMEQPDKVIALLRRVLHWNFQRDFYMDAYDFLAWTVHRNRFYTSDKYPFLKNSINENEKLANSYLDSQLRRLARNEALNARVFKPGYDDMDKMSVYHYKNILYSYAFKIDSAQHYFDLMRNSPVFSHNNYATFRAICGDFRTAESEYKKASQQDPGDKRLQEWAYYTSILDIYKGNPAAGADMMRDMIKAAGSTPGFGWYNIGLARSMYYNGNINDAITYINKAAEFKEVHIGTTLGQSHYDFSIQLQKLMDKEAQWEMQKFENSNWWYNPYVLARMGRILGDKYMQQFLIINQFSQNPERDRVIYKLFSTESTVSWDEVWYLIRDFSTRFFLDKFKYEAETDTRKYIRKYFQFFVARLEMKQGNYTLARTMLDGILQGPTIDAEYEKLFIARIMQAQAECAKERKDDVAYNDWMYKMYQLYPQLIPFTGLQMNMALHINGLADQQVLDRLKSCNINWSAGSNAPRAFITFRHVNKHNDVEYYVQDAAGRIIVPRQSFAYVAPQDAGITLAYRLFNVGAKNPHADEVADK